MRFLVDAQLPPALARMMSEHGHDAEHVIDIGPADMRDRAIWLHALEHDAVIVTKDEDFASMTAFDEAAPPIVWVRVGNVSRRALLQWFLPRLEQIVSLVQSGNKLIEVR